MKLSNGDRVRLHDCSLQRLSLDFVRGAFALALGHATVDSPDGEGQWQMVSPWIALSGRYSEICLPFSCAPDVVSSATVGAHLLDGFAVTSGGGLAPGTLECDPGTLLSLLFSPEYESLRITVLGQGKISASLEESEAFVKRPSDREALPSEGVRVSGLDWYAAERELRVSYVGTTGEAGWVLHRPVDYLRLSHLAASGPPAVEFVQEERQLRAALANGESWLFAADRMLDPR